MKIIEKKTSAQNGLCSRNMFVVSANNLESCEQLTFITQRSFAIEFVMSLSALHKYET